MRLPHVQSPRAPRRLRKGDNARFGKFRDGVEVKGGRNVRWKGLSSNTRSSHGEEIPQVSQSALRTDPDTTQMSSLLVPGLPFAAGWIPPEERVAKDSRRCLSQKLGTMESSPPAKTTWLADTPSTLLKWTHKASKRLRGARATGDRWLPTLRPHRASPPVSKLFWLLNIFASSLYIVESCSWFPIQFVHQRETR
ncbi:MAG: uncharacterized protein KVP18_000183 [Porospora cf. gigantea A]|uniref:uncharacterized protein n=1 Tax=Porospora cf. gigantea A TaxID=2853593 RepID=UPI00355A7435|nr:MAG: hypothetical protein KVP18_000183 [Porospora cf. gigantea A]